MNEPVVQLRRVSRIYRKPGTDVEVAALHEIDLDLIRGEYTAIMGASGSGKSTLMNLLGCLDRPTTGTYVLGDEDVSQLDDDALSTIRSKRIGFVFQNFNLIQQLTVLENLEVPMFYSGIAPHIRHERARNLPTASALQTGSTTARRSFPAANNNACASRGRWSTTRSFCSPTNRRARSIPRPANRFSPSSRNWSPTA